jgi:molybdopterin guanine dinucleotide-containing S/N-oxide reductase-like protein
MAEQIMTQCTVGGPVFVHVKDGKIVHIRPIVFNDEDAPSWSIKARGGKVFTPPRKACINHYVYTEKERVYSENRIKYPMKRVDWDPNGNRNPRNRGKSNYVRISWEEALDTVAGEMKRIKETYGAQAITGITSSHHNWGMLFYKMGPMPRFLQMYGCTWTWDNPDSWEGWHWGATNAWGYWWKLGHSDNFDVMPDALKNSEMCVCWSVDPNTSAGGYCGQETTIWRLWAKEAGMKLVFIDPWNNYTSALWGDKWLAPRPGTDAALAEAIAYVWIKEDTYDKWFVENRTLGFEKFRDQCLGKVDGVERTPGWASEITGIPTHDIVALAREWAAKPTMLGCGAMYGTAGACRQAYATEWARLMVYLISMQGLGKPGVNIWGGMSMGSPLDMEFYFPGYAQFGWDAFGGFAKVHAEKVNPITQKCYRLLLPEAIIDGKCEWLGEGFCGQSLNQQFKHYTFPEEGPNGGPIKMHYRHGGSFISTMTDTSRWVRMYQSPNLEFVVNQDCWWQSETKFADIILPAATNFERTDISEWAAPGGYGEKNHGTNHRIIIHQDKCIEPLWESKQDYDIYCALAERLGFLDQYTEGNSIEDWKRKVYASSHMPKYMSYEEFKKRGYFVVPSPEGSTDPSKGYDYKMRISNAWFYDGRVCDTIDPMRDQLDPSLAMGVSKKMGTKSGLIEFESQSLKEFFPDDPERPLVARYIPSWEGYDTKKLAAKYPLQLLTTHARFSYHTQYDNKCTWLDDIPVHRIKKDGYAWWPVRLHPSDAAERGIQNNDIVKVYNDRGAVLCIAVLTERLRPGTVHTFQASAKYDPLEPGNPASIDRGGCVNLLTPGRFVSKNAPGEANNSCLVEICKWEA